MSLLRYRITVWWWATVLAVRDRLRSAFGRLVLAALLDRTPESEPSAIPLSDLGGEAVVVDSWSEDREAVVALALDGRVVHLSGGRALDLAAELAHRVGRADRDR